MSLEITTDVSRLNRARLHEWLSGEAYWSRGIPRQVLDKAIDNSLCFGAIRLIEDVGFVGLVLAGAVISVGTLTGAIPEKPFVRPGRMPQRRSHWWEWRHY